MLKLVPGPERTLALADARADIANAELGAVTATTTPMAKSSLANPIPWVVRMANSIRKLGMIDCRRWRQYRGELGGRGRRDRALFAILAQCDVDKVSLGDLDPVIDPVAPDPRLDGDGHRRGADALDRRIDA